MKTLQAKSKRQKIGLCECCGERRQWSGSFANYCYDCEVERVEANQAFNNDIIDIYGSLENFWDSEC